MRDHVAGKPRPGVPSRVARPGIATTARDEATLVAGCRRQDPDSLRGLMRLHGGRVLGLLRSIVGDPQTAESLAQEAFFKAFRSMDKFKDGTNFRVWLFTIARNTALDHLRREKSSRVTPVDLAEVPEPVEPRDGPASDLEKQEQRERARAAMNRLPTGEREIVHLRMYEDLTWDAIAETLGIPEATARARMNRALERLRGALGRSA